MVAAEGQDSGAAGAVAAVSGVDVEVAEDSVVRYSLLITIAKNQPHSFFTSSYLNINHFLLS